MVVGNGHSDPSSNLDVDVYISHSVKTSQKRMHPTPLSPSIDK